MEHYMKDETEHLKTSGGNIADRLLHFIEERERLTGLRFTEDKEAAKEFKEHCEKEDK
jgi:hypothetical protein